MFSPAVYASHKDDIDSQSLQIIRINILLNCLRAIPYCVPAGSFLNINIALDLYRHHSDSLRLSFAGLYASHHTLLCTKTKVPVKYVMANSFALPEMHPAL